MSQAQASTVGGVLREERCKRRVSLEEVARTTKIPLTALNRIECNQFEKLPGEVFVRGFVRSYAAFLGLEPLRILSKLSKSSSKRSPAAKDSPASGASPEARKGSLPKKSLGVRRSSKSSPRHVGEEHDAHCALPSLAIYRAQSAGRAGFSLACFLLFLLMAASLSIVLAPRGADAKVEVSRWVPSPKPSLDYPKLAHHELAGRASPADADVQFTHRPTSGRVFAKMAC